jgi:hypothetical protein
MNVSKKLGRMNQWAKERVGGDTKTTVSDNFKAMEDEMNLRNKGTAASKVYNVGAVL